MTLWDLMLIIFKKTTEFFFNKYACERMVAQKLVINSDYIVSRTISCKFLYQLG